MPRQRDDLYAALHAVFVSPNECDSNCEAANLVDGLFAAARSARAVALAITPAAAPGHDESGGTVISLTEAVMGITAGLHRIAEAVGDLADAVREHRTPS
jgi:hypothetical protein